MGQKKFNWSDKSNIRELKDEEYWKEILNKQRKSQQDGKQTKKTRLNEKKKVNWRGKSKEKRELKKEE